MLTMEKSKSNAPGELKGVRGNLDVVMDKKVREYHVTTKTKYCVSDRPLIECSSDMNVTVDFLSISGIHDIMDVKITRQENNYGLECMEEKYLRLMDQVSNIQAHLKLAIDCCGQIKDVLNFDELHDKWQDIKDEIDPSSPEMAKIIHDGDEEYSMGSAHFAEQLNKTTLYKALGMGLFSFEKATGFDDKFMWNTPSILFPTIINNLKVIRDDVLHYTDAPMTLQVFMNKDIKDNASKMQEEFCKTFPFLKKQIGDYRLYFFCSVEKDDAYCWPVSIEWVMSESVSPVLADVVCKIELIEK